MASNSGGAVNPPTPSDNRERDDTATAAPPTDAGEADALPMVTRSDEFENLLFREPAHVPQQEDTGATRISPVDSTSTAQPATPAATTETPADVSVADRVAGLHAHENLVAYFCSVPASRGAGGNKRNLKVRYSDQLWGLFDTHGWSSYCAVD
jgi:hypothetical protein